MTLASPEFDASANYAAPDAKTIGLTLSGGGFRATLFHLGVVRVLYESGQLHQVTHICSVSGGSILAAHLVLNWERYTGDEKSFREASADLVQFVASDVRGKVVRPWLFSCALCLPLWWRRWHRTALLEGLYHRLYQGRRLRDLAEVPGRPELHLLSTSMTTGELVSFNARKMQINRATESESVAAQDLPVAYAVAASSAFPPLFPPVRMAAETFGVGPIPSMPHDHYLADGGVFDNLGIRKLLWLNREAVRFDLVVVSDAQRAFGKDFNRYTLLLNRATRSSDLLMDRVSWLEDEWIKKECETTDSELLFCRLQDRVPQGNDTLSEDEQVNVQNVRTDLDDFTSTEINALVHQGISVARHAWAAAKRKHLQATNDLQKSNTSASATTPALEFWRPLPSGPARPYTLADASRRRWGLVRFNDVFSWAFWLLLATYFVVLPVGLFWYQVKRANDAEKRLKDETDRRSASTKHVARKVSIISSLARVVRANTEPEWKFATNRWKEVEKQLSENPEYPWFARFLNDNRKELDVAVADFASRRELARGATLELSHRIRNAVLDTQGDDYISVLKDKRKEWFSEVREACNNIEIAAREGLYLDAVGIDRAKFLGLYWGEMGLVENRRVESTMVNFEKALKGWEPAQVGSLKRLVEARNQLESAMRAEETEEITYK